MKALKIFFFIFKFNPYIVLCLRLDLGQFSQVAGRLFQCIDLGLFFISGKFFLVVVLNISSFLPQELQVYVCWIFFIFFYISTQS